MAMLVFGGAAGKIEEEYIQKEHKSIFNGLDVLTLHIGSLFLAISHSHDFVSLPTLLLGTCYLDASSWRKSSRNLGILKKIRRWKCNFT